MPLKAPVQPSYELLRGLVVLRVVVITTVNLSALLIQFAFDLQLHLDPIYLSTVVGFALSIISAFTLRRIRPETHAILQILGDLLLVSIIVYITGGPATIFTFLYLAVVVSGAALFGRAGGLVVAGLAAVFYALLVYLYAVRTLRPVQTVAAAPELSPPVLVQNVALNTAAFFATALLVSSSTENLQRARADVQRRNAEIAELQALHTAVLASMSSGVLTTDLDGLVTFANRAAEDLLGTTAEALRGHSVVSAGLVDEAGWETIRTSPLELLRFEGHQAGPRSDAYFGTSVTPLKDGHGVTIGRIFIFQNLTELKKLEGEVRLKDKMAAVGELAAAIAHEIRNPLASISGSVQVLKSAPSLDAQDQRLMEIVVGESARLSAILEDFLRYVKPREKAVERMDANAALRDVLTLLTHSQEVLELHQVSLDVPEEPLWITADPGQIRQIFWNLTRNALAAMPKGGSLTVASRRNGRSWLAAFRDTGRGMTGAERDRLFTPFAHSSPGGTGLGLAIVYRIVEEHGGRIEVETAPGKGTTITIALPLEAGTA